MPRAKKPDRTSNSSSGGRSFFIPLVVLGIAGLIYFLIVYNTPNSQKVVNVYSAQSGSSQQGQTDFSKIADIASSPTIFKFKPMIEWLIKNGGWLNDGLSKIKHLGAFGFGIVANRDLVASEKLYMIPLDILFYYDNNERLNPTTVEVVKFAYDELKIQHPLAISTVALALELKDPNNFWKPYFDTFPTPDCPYYYNQQEKAAFQVPYLINKIEEIPRWIIETFNTNINKLAEKFPQAYVDSTGTMKQTPTDWVTACQYLLQRGYIYNVTRWALVPISDIINNQLVFWSDQQNQYDSFINGYFLKDGYWVLESKRNWKKNEEIYGVYNYYGTTVDYFIQYGFVTVDNKNDYVELKIADVPNTQTYFNEKAELMKTGKIIHRMLLRRAYFVIPHEFVKGVLVSLVDDATFARYYNAKTKDFTPSKDLQEQALVWMRKSIQDTLDNLPTTIEQDLALLRDGKSLSFNMRSVIQFRIEIKKLFKELISNLAAKKYSIKPNSQLEVKYDDFQADVIVVKKY